MAADLCFSVSGWKRVHPCCWELFDAPATQFHSLPCINSHSPYGYLQEVPMTRWHNYNLCLP